MPPLHAPRGASKLHAIPEELHVGLLRERRFAPYFATQFLGALTDNIFKNALVLMIAFQATSESGAGLLIGIATGLFILPFFLFSPIAGQIADKFEKSAVSRAYKITEIVVMVLAAAGFLLAHHGIPAAETLLIALLFLMGTQSAFFGPVKYSIIPEHLSRDEIMEGTSLVEMGTFVAILTGTIIGGVLVARSLYAVGASLVIFSTLGWLASRRIPATEARNPELELNWNWFSEYRALIHIANQSASIWITIIAISWFWFFGAMVLAQLPNFVKYFVVGDESVATFFLALFTLSISAGSMLSSRLSGSRIELGLVPIGAIGMTLFALDLGWIDYTGRAETPIGILDFLLFTESPTNLRVVIDLCGLGVSGALYIVPLYAILQTRSEEKTRSQVIAANNVVGALFMVVSAAMTSGLYAAGFTTAQLFLAVGAMNIIASLYIFVAMPEFIQSCATWILSRGEVQS